MRVSHPYGEFYFDESVVGDNDDTPVVLISAGVGLTCLMSILKTMVERGSRRSVSWIHGARDEQTRAFKSEVEMLKEKKEGGKLQTVYFASAPAIDDVEGRIHSYKGRVDLDRVGEDALFTRNGRARYFVCGPVQFMLDLELKLKSLGVDGGRIALELFGAGGAPRV